MKSKNISKKDRNKVKETISYWLNFENKCIFRIELYNKQKKNKKMYVYE